MASRKTKPKPTVLYRVEIIEIRTVATVKRTWEKVADTGNPNGGGPSYGWAEYQGTEKVERKLLTQELEALDLRRVIPALNKL